MRRKMIEEYRINKKGAECFRTRDREEAAKRLADLQAKMTYGCAKQILKAIGDRTDMNDMVIGYAGCGEYAARFKDFRKILEDAAETKRGFWWY